MGWAGDTRLPVLTGMSDPMAQAAIDYASYLDFARSLAAECGQVAVQQFRSGTARRKSDGSLVTKTDEEIDRLISSRIHGAYPAHAILSEEQSTTYDPADEFTWVADPLDGTTNFARGMPAWGVSLALLHAGMPVVGVLDFPLLQERYSAVAGQGTWRSGTRLHTSPITVADDQQILMKCTRTDKLFDLRSPLKCRVMGSAAYHICKVADGSALAGVEATPKVWDLAAAYLILVEAGGRIEAADGTVLFPLPAARRDYLTRAVTIFVAANQPIMDHVRRSAQPRQR
jgi:myo-inositol-1(or 4)-monophosphatase